MVFILNDIYQRLVVESYLLKTVPNFDSTHSTLATNNIFISLILKSNPRFISNLSLLAAVAY